MFNGCSGAQGGRLWDGLGDMNSTALLYAPGNSSGPVRPSET